MKTFLQKIRMTTLLLVVPTIIFAQNQKLGSAASFVIFSADGAVSNTGISQITGNVGTNNGSSTAFGNVNGGMHDQDSISALASADLLIAYNQLKNEIPTFFPSELLGNGDTLGTGVYSIGASSTINLKLYLDAKNDPNAEFIFQIQGSLSANANAKIILVNGAKACNVFWKVEGLISVGAGASLKGNFIANNAAINMNSLDTLEGRAFSTAGAVSVDGVFAYTPIGCGSPMLTGPNAPILGAAACFAIFSSDGAVSNTGETHVIGDIGSNRGSATGYNPLFVNGRIHELPDSATAKAAADLLIAYNYSKNIPIDIELLYPEQFGNNLVLTPHSYIMKAAATFTDTLFLNAQWNYDAVFFIKIEGALTTSTYSKVILMNGAQAKNIYWLIEGAVSINDYSIFCGTIICNNGALGALNTGVELKGRALTTKGALNSSAINTVLTAFPSECGLLGISNMNTEKNAFEIYPNPFNNFLTVNLKEYSNLINTRIRIFNILGIEVLSIQLTNSISNLSTQNLSQGIYYYSISDNKNVLQTGKLISK